MTRLRHSDDELWVAQRDGHPPGNDREEGDMGVVVAIIVLALVFGGVGLFVAAAKWALIIAAVLLVVGLVMAFTSSSRSRT